MNLSDITLPEIKPVVERPRSSLWRPFVFVARGLRKHELEFADPGMQACVKQTDRETGEMLRRAGGGGGGWVPVGRAALL